VRSTRGTLLGWVGGLGVRAAGRGGGALGVARNAVVGRLRPRRRVGRVLVGGDADAGVLVEDAEADADLGAVGGVAGAELTAAAAAEDLLPAAVARVPGRDSGGIAEEAERAGDGARVGAAAGAGAPLAAPAPAGERAERRLGQLEADGAAVAAAAQRFR
jgi:hypothetical protein